MENKVDDHDGIVEMLDFLMREMTKTDFVESLNEQFEKRGDLSQKQYDVLCDMYWKWGGK